ncbi:hypothetical protein Golob_004636 [Gossypium lobatum]|uniref:Uncharacterized protein n=1 Tax=Gossypium lobatum TaxID=34289 RepID=A0A7J8N2J4_9ROSI|nr:hypothetical protein [Gossypium lobatum]
MENDLADLSLEYGEDEVLLVQGESKSQNVAVDFCLVGCFLMASIVHFPAMNSIMVNIWHLVYELPYGLFSEFIAKELGDFIGKFMEYDSKILRHNDSFFQIRMIKGEESIEMSWDLSLQAQFRRAAAMNSVWLIEEEDGE